MNQCQRVDVILQLWISDVLKNDVRIIKKFMQPKLQAVIWFMFIVKKHNSKHLKIIIVSATIWSCIKSPRVSV